MKTLLKSVAIGTTTVALAISTASLAKTPHRSPHRHHRAQESSAQPARSIDADEGLVASPNSVGSLYGGGIGRAYDNGATGFDGPLGVGRRISAQVGGALVGGGAAGDAYTDYLKHYYFYKYDYCPIGTGYVWYLRRCFGLGSLIQ